MKYDWSKIRTKQRHLPSPPQGGSSRVVVLGDAGNWKSAVVIPTIFRMIAQAHDASQVFIELGAAILGLALLARLANRLGFSAIPLYLLLGLAFGNGGLASLNVRRSEERLVGECS